MSDPAISHPAPDGQPGLKGIVADWSSDKTAFKTASWGKAMIWIFLLSDTFIFSCFLLSYMTVRMSTGDAAPSAPASQQFQSRARGIGSRFSAAPARRSEKLK